MSSAAITEPPSPSRPDPRGPPTLWTRDYVRLLAMMAAIGFSFSIFFLLPKYLAVELHGTASGIGLMMATFGMASILVIPLLGRLTDRFGRRAVLVGANAALAVGAAGFALTTEMGPAVALLRGLQGAGWALSFSMAMAVVSDLAPPDRLAQAIGLSGAASLITNALAPAIGEPLAARFGYRPVFLLGALAAAAGALLARRLPAGEVAVPPQPPAPRPPPAAAPASIAAATDARGERALLLVFAQAGLAFSVLFTFLAPFALDHHVTVIRPFFTAYTVAALALRLFGARLADRLGHRPVAAVALALYGAVVAATGIFGPTSLVIIGVCFGLAHGVVFPSVVVLLLAGVPPARRPRVLGLANGAMSLGQVAVLPVGMLAHRFGYPSVFAAAGAATIASVALFLVRRTGAGGPGRR